ncbi:MAG: zinc dependent phospholipase C family protein [Bacteroidota bacterium]|nr:zinc dependent phospholipase C family protein [Bacteroidota bacterium]
MIKRILISALLIGVVLNNCYSWGYKAHQKIVGTAVFILPFEMIGFYKKHIDYLTDNASKPDTKKFVNETESTNHYIDIEHYGLHPFDSLPQNWCEATYKFTEDTLKKYGICPWHISLVLYELTEAFRNIDYDKILYYSVYISHYISDLNVPFHCTQYYDGKTVEQKGIHKLFETRIPDINMNKYNFWVGKAQYLKNPEESIWQTAKESYQLVDTLLKSIDYLNSSFSVDQRYTYESAGNLTNLVYSEEYANAYDEKTNGVVEERIKNSIYLTACLWYTAWINAGQPNLINN